MGERLHEHITSIDKSLGLENKNDNIDSALVLHFKQFVVMNCSKEQPGPIVTKTLKSGILILVDTSEELYFYTYFKYISFIKFILTHQMLRA